MHRRTSMSTSMRLAHRAIVLKHFGRGWIRMGLARCFRTAGRRQGGWERIASASWPSPANGSVECFPGEMENGDTVRDTRGDDEKGYQPGSDKW